MELLTFIALILAMCSDLTVCLFGLFKLIKLFKKKNIKVDEIPKKVKKAYEVISNFTSEAKVQSNEN